MIAADVVRWLSEIPPLVWLTVLVLVFAIGFGGPRRPRQEPLDREIIARLQRHRDQEETPR